MRTVRAPIAFVLSLAVRAGLPAAAAAADTFADQSRPDNTADCLTPATACKAIGGADGAVAKASSGSTVHAPRPTGKRAAALRRYKRKHGKARGKFTRRAKRLPL